MEVLKYYSESTESQCYRDYDITRVFYCLITMAKRSATHLILTVCIKVLAYISLLRGCVFMCVYVYIVVPINV